MFLYYSYHSEGSYYSYYSWPHAMQPGHMRCCSSGRSWLTLLARAGACSRLLAQPGPCPLPLAPAVGCWRLEKNRPSGTEEKTGTPLVVAGHHKDGDAGPWTLGQHSNWTNHIWDLV